MSLHFAFQPLRLPKFLNKSIHILYFLLIRAIIFIATVALLSLVPARQQITSMYLWYLPIQINTVIGLIINFLTLFTFLTFTRLAIEPLEIYLQKHSTNQVSQKLLSIITWFRRSHVINIVYGCFIVYQLPFLVQDETRLMNKLLPSLSIDIDSITGLAFLASLYFVFRPPAFVSTFMQSLNQLIDTFIKTKVYPIAHRISQKISAKAISWWMSFRPLPPIQKIFALRFVIILAILGIFINTYGLNFIPPQIVATYPNRNGEQALLDSVIEVQFDRPMNQKLLNNFIRITPQIEFDTAWDNDTHLVITPKQPLDRQATYTVTFTKPLVSAFYMPVINPQPITFTTIGHPVVSLATPQQEAVEDNVVITVLFDRPMVPLKTQADREELAPAFTIEPNIEGKGRWLGTSSYQFRAGKKLPPATTFSYKVAAGLKSADGGELQQDAVFQFSTTKPHIERVVPENNFDNANPAASVAAILNLPVTRKPALDAIEVQELESGKTVDGYLKVAGNRIGFFATGGLKRNTSYKAKVKKGLESSMGPNGLEADYEWTFKTIPFPAVTGSDPSNGATDIDEMHSMEVDFVSPMDEESVSNNIVISPPPDRKPSVNTNYYQSDKYYANINTYLQRSARYTVTLKGSATDIYGTPLGHDYTFSFETGPFKPSISLVPAGTYFAAFNQSVTPRIVTKVTNTSEVTYNLYQLTRNDFLKLYQLHYHPNKDEYSLSNLQSYNPSQLKLLKSWSERFDTNQNVPVNVITKVEPADGQQYPPGFYYLDARLPSGAHDNLIMIVSKATLSLKESSKNQYLVWAVNQIQAEPIQGMQIDFMTPNGNVLANGSTNQDGVLLLDKELFSKDKRQSLIVFGAKDDDIAVVAEEWNKGIERYEFSLASYYDPQESDEYRAGKDYKIHLTLDRPIYRPGQTVYFKGVIREDVGKSLVLPSKDMEVNVQVADDQDKEVYVSKFPLSTYGTFIGQFDLSKEGLVGNYTLKATVEGNSFNQSFQVEEYVPAAFETKISTDKEVYVNGERANLNIAGNYYFGAPVSGATLSWSITTNDNYYQWYKDVRYEFGTADYYDYRPWWSYDNPDYYSGKLVTEGTGKLNDKGEYQVSVPLSLGKAKTDQSLRFQTIIKNKDNEVIAGSSTVVLTASSIRVGVKPESYAAEVNKPANLSVISLDLKEREVAGIPLTLTVYKRDWSTVKEYDEDSGGYYWTSKPTDRQIGEVITATTNDTGRASLNFVPTEGGSYRIVVQGTDSEGKTSTGATYIWASGYDAYPYYENNDRVLLIPDRPDYSVNDTATVQAVVPYDSMLGLVTTERDSVYRYQLVRLTRDQKTFNLSLSDEDSPNIYVSGLFIKGGTAVKDPPQMKMGLTEIRVKNPKKQLSIEIQPDKPKYAPGETATLQFSVKNGANEPVKTELAVALVDQSVWALASTKLADIFETFYRPKNHYISTYSLLSISLDRINATLGLGSKGGSGGGCFSADTPITLSDGTAKPIQEIRVGDEVKVLVNEPGWLERMLAFILSKNDVKTTSALVTKLLIHDEAESVQLVLDDRTLTTTSVHKFFTGRSWQAIKDMSVHDRVIDEKGQWHLIKSITPVEGSIRVYNFEVNPSHTYFAGGIWVHNQKGEDDTSRDNFQDTVYWNGKLETDTAGNASVKVKLADNTTTWRVIAQGVSMDSAVGQADSRVLATKDVLIRPLLPRFVSIGDVPRFGFAIHNRSDAESQVEASIVVDHMNLDGGAKQPITIPPHTEKNVYWTGTVTKGQEMKVEITVKQQDKVLDAITKTLPIQSYYTKEVVAFAGQTENQAEEKINKPEEIVQDAGNLQYTLSPIMGLSTLTDSIKYFFDYGYWCVEQTSSRILTYAPLLKLEKSANGLFDENTVNQMNSVVTDALQRLVAAQRVDGGWTWWKDDPYPSNPVLSAIALEALRSARDAGFTVDNQVTSKGIDYLTGQLNSSSLSLSDKSYIARTIALYEPVSAGTLSNLMNRRWEMDAKSRGDLLSALDLSGSGITDRNRLYNELMSLMKKTNTTTHFAERQQRKNDYYSYFGSSPNQLTASMMEAITRRNPKNPVLSEILRYFDTSKQQGYWRSTRETALVSHAIANLIDRRNDLKGEFDWQLVLNGTKVANGALNPKTSIRQLTGLVPLQDLQSGDNLLKFMKSGPGNMYYNLNYSYYLPFTDVPAREQGIVLLREILDSDGNAIGQDAFKQGEEYWVRLTLAAPQRVANVIIEDKLPAGFEAVNESLATTATDNVDRPDVNQTQDESLNTPDYQDEKTVSLSISHQEMRDDRVVLFANTIYPGVYEYTYRVHASIPGKFHYPPASASNMYVPEINGHSSGGWLTIKDSR